VGEAPGVVAIQEVSAAEYGLTVRTPRNPGIRYAISSPKFVFETWLICEIPNSGLQSGHAVGTPRGVDALANRGD